jgi:hypothetical protein
MLHDRAAGLGNGVGFQPSRIAGAGRMAGHIEDIFGGEGQTRQCSLTGTGNDKSPMRDPGAHDV